MTTREHSKEVLLRLFLRYSRALAVGIAAAVLAVGYLTLIGGKVTELRDVGVSGLRSQEETLAERRDYLNRLQEMIVAFEQRVAAADRAFIERAIPTGRQVPNLLSIFNDLAGQVGFTVETVAVSEGQVTKAAAAEASDAARLGSVLQTVRGQTTEQVGARGSAEERALKVRVSLKGPAGYQALRQLLSAVEQSERIFDLEQVSFVLGGAPSAPGEGTTSGAYELTILTPYLLEPSN